MHYKNVIDDISKLIFVENPKSASTAVKQALTGNRIADPYDPRTATINHRPPKEIKERYPEKWGAYRSFVVVRNTWDRALSFFNFYAGLLKAKSYEEFDFDNWVLAGCPRPTEDHFQSSLPRKHHGTHFLCQLQYTEEVEHVITLNSFDPHERALELKEGLQALSALWGFSLFPIMHNVNAMQEDNESMSWSDQSIDYLAEIFEQEISMFGSQPPN